MQRDNRILKLLPLFTSERRPSFLNAAVLRILLILVFPLTVVHAQDSTGKKVYLSGMAGLTNNGLSIIPSFSLNAPSYVFNMSVGGKRFTMEPDMRFTLDGRKGGMILWFRYKWIRKGKFRFNVGAHPAYNFALREVTDNGSNYKIIQARRFFAMEAVPVLTVNDKMSVGLYYLHARGLQLNGPRKTHFLTVNTNIHHIPVFNNFYFQFMPQFYYLKIDAEDGVYFTANASLSHKKWPLLLQSTINQEIRSRISGSKNFMWNLTLFYRFSAEYSRKK